MIEYEKKITRATVPIPYTASSGEIEITYSPESGWLRFKIDKLTMMSITKSDGSLTMGLNRSSVVELRGALTAFLDVDGLNWDD